MLTPEKRIQRIDRLVRCIQLCEIEETEVFQWVESVGRQIWGSDTKRSFLSVTSAYRWSRKAREEGALEYSGPSPATGDVWIWWLWCSSCVEILKVRQTWKQSMILSLIMEWPCKHRCNFQTCFLISKMGLIWCLWVTATVQSALCQRHGHRTNLIYLLCFFALVWPVSLTSADEMLM